MLRSVLALLILVSGALAGGQRARVTSRGIAFENMTPYAGFHQSGAGPLPVRMMVPTADRGLPPRWTADFKRIIELEWQRVL